jgi:ribonuclease HI
MGKWIYSWIRNGRLEEPDALANQDLWTQLVALAQKHEITWQWVRGHAGHPFNERCDKLAKRAAEDGMRAVKAANQPEKTIPEKDVCSKADTPVKQEPILVREDSEFDAEEDGQLRLC